MCVSKISFKLVTQHLNCQMRISPEAPNWFSSHRDVEDRDVGFFFNLFNLVLLKVRKASNFHWPLDAVVLLVLCASCQPTFLTTLTPLSNDRKFMFSSSKQLQRPMHKRLTVVFVVFLPFPSSLVWFCFKGHSSLSFLSTSGLKVVSNTSNCYVMVQENTFFGW